MPPPKYELHQTQLLVEVIAKPSVIIIIIRRIKRNILSVVLVLVLVLGSRKMPVVRWRIGNYKNETCVNANNCKNKDCEQLGNEVLT